MNKEYQLNYYKKNKEKLLQYQTMKNKEYRKKAPVVVNRYGSKRNYKINYFIQKWYEEKDEIITWLEAERILQKLEEDDE